MYKSSILLTLLLINSLFMASMAQAQKKAPLRVGVAGLNHGHAPMILNYKNKEVVDMVGIAEPDRQLAEQYAKKYGFSMDIVYPTLEEMLDKTKPEAVAAFNSILGHLEVVKTCAPRGIHVMVEKPLAISLDHARQMEALAKKHKIYLLTNYETTWYGSTHKAYAMVHQDKSIGDIRKMVVHDGHPGPKEIGVGKEFLDWLTDPEQNGGGALIDFGCYGADLISWLMKGERPVSVTAITQQIKPDIYPKVDDEATIILTYPKAQGIIQASWNWPVSRKDMAIYGKTGYIQTIDALNMRVRLDEKSPETTLKAEPTKSPQQNPFDYLAAVIKGDIKPGDDLSSLSINMVAMEILDAARRSAKEGKTIYLTKK